SDHAGHKAEQQQADNNGRNAAPFGSGFPTLVAFQRAVAEHLEPRAIPPRRQIRLKQINEADVETEQRQQTKQYVTHVMALLRCGSTGPVFRACPVSAPCPDARSSHWLRA